MNKNSHPKKSASISGILAFTAAFLADAQLSADPTSDVIVYGWNPSAAWTTYVDQTQATPYADASSATYSGSTWTCDWNINASTGTINSSEFIDRPSGSTASTVVQSRVYLYDIFHVDAGTSGLSVGTPVTFTLSGSFSGYTRVDAVSGENGSTNLGMNVINVTNSNYLFSESISQNCYTNDSQDIIFYNRPFSAEISTTIGSSLTMAMGFGPSTRNTNPGTQTQGCEGIGHTSGFDFTGTWEVTPGVTGLSISTDGGLTAIPEPATTSALLALSGLLFAWIRRRK
jgi:hypothetical protein